MNGFAKLRKWLFLIYLPPAAPMATRARGRGEASEKMRLFSEVDVDLYDDELAECHIEPLARSFPFHYSPNEQQTGWRRAHFGRRGTPSRRGLTAFRLVGGADECLRTHGSFRSGCGSQSGSQLMNAAAVLILKNSSEVASVRSWCRCLGNPAWRNVTKL